MLKYNIILWLLIKLFSSFAGVYVLCCVLQPKHNAIMNGEI